MRFTDRTRSELDHTCPRARFWGYEYKGIGLSPLEEPEELAFGKGIADQLANIKLGHPVTLDAFSGDQAILAEAMLEGYSRYVWPRWQQEFELLEVETEKPKQLTEWLTYNARPDTITRRRSDGALFYGPEDKTTAWVDSLLNYTNNVQLQATALCIETHSNGELVAGCIVQGLYKGFKKEGRLYQSLAWAYCKEGVPGITPDQWHPKWQRGWERLPTTQYNGGVGGWITFLEKKFPEELSGAFPRTQPVSIRRDLAQAYLNQVRIREQEIEVWRQQGRPEGALPVVFPQHFNHCDEFSRSRKPCPYKPLCWNPTAQKFPMTFYKFREPHHANEKEALSAQS